MAIPQAAEKLADVVEELARSSRKEAA